MVKFSVWNITIHKSKIRVRRKGRQYINQFRMRNASKPSHLNFLCSPSYFSMSHDDLNRLFSRSFKDQLYKKNNQIWHFQLSNKYKNHAILLNIDFFTSLIKHLNDFWFNWIFVEMIIFKDELQRRRFWSCKMRRIIEKAKREGLTEKLAHFK